jgi:Lon-like protease
MRVLRAGFLPASCLALVSAALIVPLPYVIERPGRTLSLAACVEVHEEKATPVDGEFLLMTISVEAATAVEMISGIADPHTLVVDRHVIVPAGQDETSYFAEQQETFGLMADRAAAIALQSAGLPAKITGQGAEIVAAAADSPAAGVLQPGDVVVDVGGVAVTDETDLRSAVEALPAGEETTVAIRRAGKPMQTTLVPIDLNGRIVLGVYATTHQPRAELPVGVDVASGGVGGPSAGLMIALTVYDKILPEFDLAQGRTIAGTGSLDDEGRVGPIGGVALKIVAAERAGADIFLAPAANYEQAAAAVSPGSKLQVISVDSFDDARRALGEQPAAAGENPSPQRCPYEPAA